jgi:hypothetical protein
MDDSCEMKRRGEWVRITIEDALNRHSDKRMRCPACHGRVKAIRASVNGVRAHFEHHAAHAGYPRGDSYSGIPSPIPTPYNQASLSHSSNGPPRYCRERASLFG